MNLRNLLPLTLATTILMGMLSARPAFCDIPDVPGPDAPKPRAVTVHLAFLVSVRQPDGMDKETRLQAPVVSSIAGKTSKISIGNMKPDGTGEENGTEVTPEINSDGTITLHVLWRQRSMERKSGGENTRVLHEVAVTRKVNQGKPLRVELEKFPGVTYCLDMSAEEMGASGGTKQP